MKTKSLNLIIALMVLGITSVFSQNSKTEKFEVYGNCGMCENRIEKAAKSVDGVTSVDWDKETKIVEVSFDESKTDVHKIQVAIAEVGHDTELHKADDKVYDALPACCQYDRPKAVKEEKKQEGHNH